MSQEYQIVGAERIADSMRASAEQPTSCSTASGDPVINRTNHQSLSGVLDRDGLITHVAIPVAVDEDDFGDVECGRVRQQLVVVIRSSPTIRRELVLDIADIACRSRRASLIAARSTRFWFDAVFPDAAELLEVETPLHERARAQKQMWSAQLGVHVGHELSDPPRFAFTGQPAQKKLRHGTSVGKERNKVEPASPCRIDQRNRSIRCIHGSYEPHILGQLERIVRTADRAHWGVAVLEQEQQFAEHFGRFARLISSMIMM